MTNLPLLEKDEHRQDFGRKLINKRHNAKRLEYVGALGNLWSANNRDKANERQRKYRLEHGRYSELISKQRNPINILSSNILVTSDYHVPFQDNDLLSLLLWVQEEHEARDLAIVGDLFDMDNYSRYTHLGYTESFAEEKENVRQILTVLLEFFQTIYICRGNHEKRWIDLNAGRMDMMDLFTMTLPEVPNTRYKVTQDDHMYLYQQEECWLLCHPKSYRQTNLSVAKDLAAKHHCHVGVAHGHQFAQGYDRSGKYKLFDMGGLFDKKAIDYLRETTTHPETKSGFYLIQDNNLYPFEL